jgi:hypothetical protein
MTKEEKKVVNAENVAIPQSKPNQEKTESVQNHANLAHTHANAVPNHVEKVMALDPAILDAINQAVAGAVKTIVAQVVPQQQVQAASTVAQPQASNGLPPMRKPISRLKGIPVEPGQDLRHVPAWRINEWFRDIEIKAQERIKQQGRSMQAEMSWTRG